MRCFVTLATLCRQALEQRQIWNMDDKSNSDTNNNNEALRLANHDASAGPSPSTSGVAQLIKDIGRLAGDDGHRSSSPGLRDDDDDDDDDDLAGNCDAGVPKPNDGTRAEDGGAVPSPDDGTETAGRNPKSSGQNRVNRCNLCGKKCLKASEFKRHLVYHLSRKPFKCNECGKRFQVKSNMLLHQRAAHSDRYNHEFLDCLPGVRSSQSEMPVLCPEIYGGDELGGLGAATKSLSHGSEQLKRDAGNSDGTKSENSPGSNKGNGQEGSGASPRSNSGSSREMGESDELMGDEEEYSIDYPSVFPGLKHQLSVKNETVLVTRLDGINKSTKEKLSLFKCHMCGKIFNFLSRLQCHLSLHFERTVNVFVCTYCDAHFQFKTQLAQHLLRSHEVHLSPNDDILDLTELSPQLEQTQPSPGESQEPKDADGGELNTSSHTSMSYSGYNASSVNYAADGKNSGSPPGGAISGLSTAGTLPSWLQDDDNMHYSVSARALYSRVNGLYICQFCNKGFDRLFSLSRHERVHTGFKPCYCKYCGRGFSEPRNLRHHIVRFHSDVGDGQVIKRIRKGMPLGGPWRVNRKVSHSSQRLTYVPPDMTTKGDDEDEDSQSFQALTSNKDVASPSGQSEKDSISPQADSTDMQQPIIIEPKSDSNVEQVSQKELANEIREKEKLDEDVMVVIPSDAPLNDGKDRDLTTPKSTCSDSMNWSEADVDTGSVSNEIVSAPIKTLMSHHQQSRPRRKMSFTATATPTPGDERSIAAPSTTPEEQDIKPKMEPPSEIPTSSLCGPFPTPDNPLPSVSTPLSLPFNPLNISTYMAPGLGGLLPSPLISPLNQAFFAQQGLASPSVVPNPLSFFSPLPNPTGVATSLIPTPSTASQLNAAKDTPPVELTSAMGSSQHAHSPTESDASSVRCSLDDLQSWMAKGNTRASALSRSQSSRLYVVRQPVKREEACKPIVLPDGRTVYRCTYCNKDFCTFSDVNRHMDFHEGLCKDIRPYKCKYCDYYARTNSQLKVHMMRHQGIREFHCKLCNYKGVTQSDLNRHMKSQIHMMKSQNACKHCGEGFVSPKNLERHYHEKHFSQYEQMATSHAMHAAKLS